ncbi:MAG: lipoyl synthase [Gemmatimonadota bacterium]|nr:MAG: lipoyl synthase [Gemmatimonadota bacterium]
MRKPAWLKSPLHVGEHFKDVTTTLQQLRLHTVGQEAACPNLGECWGRGTATFMILGDVCTRVCRFCNVSTGHPSAPDEEEPHRVAEAVKALSLKYCVITSVTRDDLSDGGAANFAFTVKAIRSACNNTSIEVLIPDFDGNVNSLQKIIDAGPDVISHNVETVARLTPEVRDRRTDYDRSLFVLEQIKESNPVLTTKSGFMVGLGEIEEEILGTMQDLRNVGCDIITIGQYLQPSKECVPVIEYVHPDTFDEYRKFGEAIGFQSVASGPLVRSSYLADHYFKEVG